MMFEALFEGLGITHRVCGLSHAGHSEPALGPCRLIRPEEIQPSETRYRVPRYQPAESRRMKRCRQFISSLSGMTWTVDKSRPGKTKEYGMLMSSKE